MIAHLEIPDIEKAWYWYSPVYNISKADFDKLKSKLRICFADGSYWHDMKKLKSTSEKLLKSSQGFENAMVEIRPSNCPYRSDLVIRL